MATDFKVNVKADTKEYKKGLKESATLAKEFAKKINGIVPDFKKSIQSFQTYGAQIGQATAAQKLMTNQIKSTQQGGDFLANSNQALSQGFQSLANNLIGVKTNMRDAMRAAWDLSEQMDAMNTGKIFADQFGQEAKTRLMEFDLAQQEVQTEIKKAKKTGDLQSQAYHTNRLREIFEQRKQALGMLTEIQQRQQQLTEQSVKESSRALITEVGVTEERMERLGLNLHDVLYNQFLPSISDTDPFKMMYDNYLQIKKEVKNAPIEVEIGTVPQMRINRQFEDFIKQAKNLKLPKDYAESVYIYGQIVEKQSDKQHQAFGDTFIQLQNLKQAQLQQNQEAEKWEQWLIKLGVTQEQVDEKTSKGQEKQLKTLKDLQDRQKVLRELLQKTTDPYLLKQYNDELKGIEKTINEITKKPALGLLSAMSINPVLVSIKEKMSRVKEERNKQTSLIQWRLLDGKLKELKQTYDALVAAMKEGAPIVSQDGAGGGVPSIKSPSFLKDMNSDLQAKQQRALNKQVDDFVDKEQQAQKAVRDLQSQFGNLGTVIGENNKEQGLQMAIVSIMQGQAEGIGKAFSKNVWYGIAAAQAQAASVQATISSFSSTQNKYATGGIVKGNSYQGDKIPQMVNAGEMILNNAQQRNLFSMLENGIGGGNNSFSLEVRGTQLEAVRRNTLNKNRKINYIYD